MSNATRTFLTATLAMATCITIGYAQDEGAVASILRPPIDVPQPPCNVSMGVVLSGDFGSATFTASGSATFTTTSVTPASEAAGNTQAISSLSASAETEFGTVTWELSGDDATATTITANQRDADFPATADIYFTPTATISSRPFAKYKATSEVHLQSTNLSSFGPQVNEGYAVEGSIEFEDEITGERFTIELSDIVVTGTEESKVLRPDIGTIIKCPAKWRTIFTSDEFGTIEFDASATAEFETSTVTADADVAGNTQKTVSLDASVDVEQLGTITWYIADGDATESTTISASQEDANFPATSDIYFRPSARISSQPGTVYRATREVHLQNNNLTTFNPQVDESYSEVEGLIEFTSEETGQSFTIELQNFVVGGAADADDQLLSQNSPKK